MKAIDMDRICITNPTPAEKKLLAVLQGDALSYTILAENRIIRADLISWVFAHPHMVGRFPKQGVHIVQAHIEGSLDLKYYHIPFPLSFEQCSFSESVELSYSNILGLELDGCQTKSITGEYLNAEAHICLRDGFRAEGKVSLKGSKIKGTLDCNGGRFLNDSDLALICEDISIGGDCLLGNGFECRGEAFLGGAAIDGDLVCEKGKFLNPDKISFYGEGLKANRLLFKKGFIATGEVILTNANIGGSVDCHKGRFINPKHFAIDATRIKINGPLFLTEGFQAKGEVRLIDAEIRGGLIATKGSFMNPDKVALNCDRMKVTGPVFLEKGFKAEGEVRLQNARIEGVLKCSKGQFSNSGGMAIYAEGVKVEGHAFLDKGFSARGEVVLQHAHIGGCLDCSRGLFENAEGYALNGSRVEIAESAFFGDGFEAKGMVTLFDAEIKQKLFWKNQKDPSGVILVLESAKIGSLGDDQESWPSKGRLFLNNLVYDHFDDESPMDSPSRLDWLRRQPSDRFRSQPYEQLAACFKKTGNEEDAKKILVEKNRDRRRFTKLTWEEKIWYSYLGELIGYGYRPWWAFWLALAIIICGTVAFMAGEHCNIMAPTQEGAYSLSNRRGQPSILVDYPKFNALAYSVDSFVPLLDLHQCRYWLPNANRIVPITLPGFNKSYDFPLGSLLRWYHWFHIISGWILTSLFVIGLSGKLRT